MLIALVVLSPLFPAQDLDPQLDPGGFDLETLEARFEERMSGVRLVGRFTDDSRPADAPLGEDGYVIHEMAKLDDGTAWAVEAEIGVGEHDVPVELELDVLWAGDTPVLTLTDRKVPSLGSYSARIVIHGDRYAGVWSGADHGGHLFGRIESLEDPGSSEDAEQTQDAGDAEQPEESAGSAVSSDAAGDWPSFHGPRGGGVQDGWDTPLTWDVESGENVLWSAPVAGLAHSSPVVHGERIYLTTSVPVGDEEPEVRLGIFGDVLPVKGEGPQHLRVMCFDRGSGEQLWSRTAFTGVPSVKRHPKASHAASTPATDGRRVVAFFGSEGLFCYDTEGELLWTRDLGPLDAGYYLAPKVQWGFASSPVLHDGRVLVQCDVNGPSFLAALDATDGADLWRVEREEVPTWSTPTVAAHGGREQVICNGYKHIGGYDLQTGEELWRMAGGGDIPVPTPVVSGERVYVMNAHGRMSPILAIELAARGELSMDADEEEFVAWAHKKGGNYMQTPLVVGGLLFGCNDLGILGCWDADSGEQLYRERLGSGGAGFTSSIVSAGGRLYCASEGGEVFVVRVAREHEVLAVNDLGESCMATPAISRGVLYYRTRSRLVAIGS